MEDVDQRTMDIVSGFCGTILRSLPSDIMRVLILYYFVGEEFDPNNCPKYHLSNNNKIAQKCDTGWTNAYLTKIVSYGVHRWKFKLVYDDVNLPLSMGVFKTKRALKQGTKNRAEDWDTKDGYIVIVSYQRRSAKGMKIGESYGKRKSKSGDIIEMILDLNKHTLSYMVNEEDWGTAFDNIEQTSYRAVVAAGYWWDKFELLSYQQCE